MLGGAFIVFVVLAIFVFWIVAKTAVVVPQQNAFVVERLGRFAGVLDAGFHILVPFVDVIRYRHVLKEQAMDIPEQVCITRDNVQVAVDGILYLKVMDPERASYGISNYHVRDHPARPDDAPQRDRQDRPRPDLRGAHQHQHPGGDRGGQGLRGLGRQGPALRDQEHHPARRTSWPPWRSRCAPSARSAPSSCSRKASATPPSTPPKAQKQQVIKASEAKKQQQINEAEGPGVGHPGGGQGHRRGHPLGGAPPSRPTAASRPCSSASPSSTSRQFGHIAKAGNTLVIPSNLSDVGSMIALAMNVIQSKPGAAPAARAAGASLRPGAAR